PAEASEIARAWEAYHKALDERALWDFDDLVDRALTLLQERPDVLATLQGRYRYISIDEYQDIDERQVRLIKLLAPKGTSIAALGDPDQAIYGFRGADVGLFLRFQDDFAGARVLRITRNYRSTRPILDAALQVISSSPTIGVRALVPMLEGTQRASL